MRIRLGDDSQLVESEPQRDARGREGHQGAAHGAGAKMRQWESAKLPQFPEALCAKWDHVRAVPGADRTRRCSACAVGRTLWRA